MLIDPNFDKDTLYFFLEKDSIHLIYKNQDSPIHFSFIIPPPFSIKHSVPSHEDLESLTSCLIQFNNLMSLEFPYRLINGLPKDFQEIFYQAQAQGINLAVDQCKELNFEDFKYLRDRLEHVYERKFINQVHSLVVKAGGRIVKPQK